MPANLATALRNRYGTDVPQASPTIYGRSPSINRVIPLIIKSPPDNTQLVEILSRSDGVMTRVRMVNATLRHLGIRCSELDTLAGAGTIQLAAVQEMVRAGNRQGTQTALSRFRMTVTTLCDTYREILIREDLPGEAAQGVLSVAKSLDITAVRAGTA
ncbi:MAG: hypothetical protein M0Q92_10965 [Methanoregula sp.]|jgi:hypothetical protein|nr:hypothetical protein [Methanoregula sp.]